MNWQSLERIYSCSLSLLYRTMNRHYLRLLKFVPLLILIPAVIFSFHTFKFEAYLSALSITLDDFPEDYSEALTEAVNHHRRIEYNHTTFPTFDNTSSNTIPPTIHFIWFHDLYNRSSTDPLASKIPHSSSHAPKRCRLFNPDYEINIWNATSARTFLTEHYAWILPTYDSYPYPIQQVDVLKYFVLYHYGGVYMDLDIACRRPLDPLLMMPAWFAKASPLGLNNDLIAARPGHPVIKALTESLQGRAKWLGSEWVTVFWSTGPRFVSDIVKWWVEKHPAWRYRRGEPKDADEGMTSSVR